MGVLDSIFGGKHKRVFSHDKRDLASEDTTVSAIEADFMVTDGLRMGELAVLGLSVNDDNEVVRVESGSPCARKARYSGQPAPHPRRRKPPLAPASVLHPACMQICMPAFVLDIPPRPRLSRSSRWATPSWRSTGKRLIMARWPSCSPTPGTMCPSLRCGRRCRPRASH